VIAASWWDRIGDDPIASVVAVVALLGVAVGAGWALRLVARRTRSLRDLLLVMTFGSLLVGAVVALALARLMVLDGADVAMALGVLAVTAVFATVLVLTASGPLRRDARGLEAAVRRIEAGDLTVRTDVRRADELGHVARAIDELTQRLDTMEHERRAIEDERRAMLSSIGHDLRTPLSALRVAVEALADGVAPDPQRYLRSMQSDVEALGGLIDDLFLLARIESGNLDLERVPLDLSELVDEAVEALTPAAAARDVRIVCDTSPLVRVAGNATALGRVVRNLLDNAIQHAPGGSTVRIVVDGDEQRPRVEVSDEGPGFPAEFTAHAFERFTRADPSRNRSTGGAGLGLAIARGLVEAHGGRIWIGGPPGGRVAFDLPTV
jgi:signal transduction histidine kinase